MDAKIKQNILTTIIIQFNSIGTEKTIEIKSPLLSKYCCRENSAQFLEANSLMLSEKNTMSTEKIMFTIII